MEDHRIIELLRLENTSKIIETNRQPNTTMPAKLSPEVPHLHVSLHDDYGEEQRELKQQRKHHSKAGGGNKGESWLLSGFSD